MKSLLAVLLFTVAALGVEPIPGLAPVDIYLNLEGKGFTTDKRYGKEQHTFECKEQTGAYLNTASITIPAGQGADQVTVVNAMHQNYSEASTDALAVGFLGYCATLPYDGAEPAKARAWVEANLGKNVSAVFGGVKFELFANGRTRILRLSKALELPNLIGKSYPECVKEWGEAWKLDRATGWAEWGNFKARFKDRACVEVAPK